MAQALVDINAQLKEELKQLNKQVAAPSGFNIGTKGKQFAFPDGKTSDGPIDAVILDWRNVHQYYPGVYNQNKPEPPKCFAVAKNLDDLAPPEGLTTAVHETCKGCPKDEFGSAPGGGRGKACKNSVKLAIVPADATVDTPVWTINVSATAIRNWTNYTNTLSSTLGVLPIQVVTELKFNPNESFPTLLFGQPRPHENLDVMMRLREVAQALLNKTPEVA